MVNKTVTILPANVLHITLTGWCVVSWYGYLSFTLCIYTLYLHFVFTLCAAIYGTFYPNLICNDMLCNSILHAMYFSVLGKCS